MGWVVLTPAQYSLYIGLWGVFCLLALGIVWRDWPRLRPIANAYPRFLFMPWKLGLFLPAFLFVTFAGRFTNDETWDLISGSGMSILTYLTAPLALGLFFQVVKGQRPRRDLIIAAAFCLFSSSWFYDLYLLCRDGEYTARWLGNLMLSPIIYMAAGLLWNLEATPDGRVTLSFLRADWPAVPRDQSFRPLLWFSLPLILVAAFILVAYVDWHM